MADRAWGARRQCQFAHIKKGLIDRGKPECLAADIAARVVNNHRGQRGEAVLACAAGINDLPAGRATVPRSRALVGARTVRQLRREARERGVKGRSAMNKAQLLLALRG